MNSTYNSITLVAAEAISEFSVVALDSAGKAALPSAATDDGIIGVAQRTVAAGDPVEVLVYGITRVKASGMITFATTPILQAEDDGEVSACASGSYPIARVLPNVNQLSTAGAGEQFFAFFLGSFTPLA